MNVSKGLKSSARKKPKKKGQKERLSLHPLSLESALGAALKTGRMPPQKKKRKKSVDKKRRGKDVMK
jgi:hypothetical protein